MDNHTLGKIPPLANNELINSHEIYLWFNLLNSIDDEEEFTYRYKDDLFSI